MAPLPSSLYAEWSWLQYLTASNRKKWSLSNHCLFFFFFLNFWHSDSGVVMPCNQRKTYTGHLLATHWRLLPGNNLCGWAGAHITLKPAELLPWPLTLLRISQIVSELIFDDVAGRTGTKISQAWAVLCERHWKSFIIFFIVIKKNLIAVQCH